jgi:hypothetical protein
MDASRSPAYSQKADVKQISFVLQTAGGFDAQVVLPIRPEDLTRSEPQRASVHQTLGRETQGWVDHFGAGLPQININGHTGWNYKPGLGQEGFESFESLNRLVAHDYPAAMQDAIDMGRDPSTVRLLFVDLLDNFAYPVVPQQFVLRRSKSSPLLFRYNIAMQAIDTQIDGGIAQFFPPVANLTAGRNALDGAVGQIEGLLGNVGGAFSLSGLRGFSDGVMVFVNRSVSVLRATQGVISGANGFITSSAGAVIGIAKGLSQVGREVFNTLAAVSGIPLTAKAAFMQMAAAYNEVVCVFSNALKPRQTYEDYDGLFGASNCSSTTGGRMPSAFSNQNVFAVINPQNAQQPVSLGGAALSSVGLITGADAVLAPIGMGDMVRHLEIINAGTKVAQ